MEAEVTSGFQSSVEDSYNDDVDERTPDGLMKKGLFAASKQPAKPSDIKSFQALHSPRIHGMAEWILQYETAHRQQDQYLQQIKELRQQFRTRRDGNSHQPRNGKSFSTGSSSKPSFHWSPSRLPLTKFSDDKFANKACILHPRRKHKIGRVYGDYWQGGTAPSKVGATDFLIAPKAIISDSYSQKHAREPVTLPHIGEFDRNKTDYEPIEHIAKRNKLNLNNYLKQGQKWTRAAGRDTLDMSDVCVQSTKIA